MPSDEEIIKRIALQVAVAVVFKMVANGSAARETPQSKQIAARFDRVAATYTQFVLRLLITHHAVVERFGETRRLGLPSS